MNGIFEYLFGTTGTPMKGTWKNTAVNCYSLEVEHGPKLTVNLNSGELAVTGIGPNLSLPTVLERLTKITEYMLGSRYGERILVEPPPKPEPPVSKDAEKAPVTAAVN